MTFVQTIRIFCPQRSKSLTSDTETVPWWLQHNITTMLVYSKAIVIRYKRDAHTLRTSHIVDRPLELKLQRYISLAWHKSTFFEKSCADDLLFSPYWDFATKEKVWDMDGSFSLASARTSRRQVVQRKYSSTALEKPSCSDPPQLSRRRRSVKSQREQSLWSD